MKQHITRDNWLFEDYFAFLLVYAAEADFVIREEEREAIVDKVGRERFIQLLAYYKDLKDVERIDIVYEFKDKYCPTEEDGKRTLAQIEEILRQDHQLLAVEQELLLSLKKMLRFRG
jgi:hypothetical protein